MERLAGIKPLFFIGVATVALVAAPANAQTQTIGPAPGAQGPLSSTNSEIIVTAQRREERAQDVPIAITAFTGEALSRANITQPQDLYGSVPSLTVGNQGQAVRDVQSYSIRGQSTGFLASPAVAVYLAEVPLPASTTLNLQGAPGMFVDLENVQVLSGPQGTLFGRNTTGGAVLFTPRKPTGRFGGYIEGSLGNYDLRGAEGAINLPVISDKLMIRAVGAYRDRRGYTRDLIWDKWRDDTHWYSGRLGILLRPTEAVENYLLLFGAKSSNNGAGHIHRGWNYDILRAVGFCANTPGPGSIAVPCSVYRRQTEIANSIGPRATRAGLDEYATIQTRGLINTTSLELGDDLTLKNIFSYQKLRDDYATDQDGTPIQQYDSIQNADLPSGPIIGLSEFGLPLAGYANGAPDWDKPRDSLKQFSNELQLQGKLLDNQLDFAVGGFYYKSSPDRTWGQAALFFCPAAFTGLCGITEYYSSGITSESKAVYAQSTLNLAALAPRLDRLRLTAGIRYTWDKVGGTNYSFRADEAVPGNVICGINGASVPAANAPLPANFALLTDSAAGCRAGATLKSKAPTWTIGLDYKPTAALLLYAKVSRGYKAGGINTGAVRPETQIFVPEKLTSYEVGFKSDWRLGSVPVRLNAAYYYSDYSNIQRPAGDFNTLTNISGAQILAASASIQGFEVETSIRPLRGVEIGATVSHVDGDYKRFTQKVLSPAGQLACNGYVPAGQVADYSCNRFQYVTPWIVNVHANVDVPLANSLGMVSLFVNYSKFSSQNTSPLTPPEIGDPGVIIGGYGLLNASLAWREVAGTKLDAALFGSNLTNKLYRVSNSGVFTNLGVWSELYGEPRMYGLKLTYRFGD